MSKLSLPPVLDTYSIIRSSVPATVDTWYAHLVEGAHGVKIAPGVNAAVKVYGQDISREAVTHGSFNSNERFDRLTREILLTLWTCTRGRQLDLRPCDPLTLPFRRDGLEFKFPVPGMIIERGFPTFLCIQARKKPPFPRAGYRFFGKLLQLAVDRTPHVGADVEFCDLSAPNGVTRRPRTFNLSSLSLISDSELDEKLAILAEAYDILSSMELPEPKIKKRKGPPEQDDFGF